jgi:hypothetical protein
MITKQNLFLVLTLSLAILFNACEKDDAEPTPVIPETSFETDQMYYEPGDTIQVVNTSTKAERYQWTIDVNDQVTSSEEENPVIIAQIPEGNYRAFYDITLTAYSETGDSSSVTKEAGVGYRTLDYVKFQSIDHPSIQNMQTDSVILYTFLGAESNPDYHNIGDNRTFPAQKVKKQETVDVMYDLPYTGNLFYLTDEPWFLKLYAVNPSGGDDYLLMEKTFNPTEGGEWAEDHITGTLLLEWEEAQVEIGLRYSFLP